MKKTLSLTILGVLVTACSNGNSEHPGSKLISEKFDSVTMQRTACYGQCPIYAVEILGNGKIKYTGKEFVRVKGVRQSSVPSANVELLAAALRHVKFEEMQEKYQFERDGCVSMPTDFPSFEISVTKAGKTKHVAFYTGCHGPTVPSENLEWLSNTIDVMAQTGPLVSQWPDVKQ
jgi:hypothetical protein